MKKLSLPILLIIMLITTIIPQTKAQPGDRDLSAKELPSARELPSVLTDGSKISYYIRALATFECQFEIVRQKIIR